MDQQYITLRYCFKRLVVSEHGTLRFLYEHKEQQPDPAWQARLRGWMRQFQHFVAAAEESYRKVRKDAWHVGMAPEIGTIGSG